jgi:hypothetical protein
MYVLIICAPILRNIPFQEQLNDKLPYMYVCLHVKDPLFLSDFNKIGFFSMDFPNVDKYKIFLT